FPVHSPSTFGAALPLGRGILCTFWSAPSGAAYPCVPSRRNFTRQSWTTIPPQSSKNNALIYEEFLRLRHAASQIGNVQRGTVYNHRLLTSGVPLRWLERRVESPVLFLHSGQRLWLPVIRRARA